MTLLPPHDRINCNICFDNKSIQWGKTEREVNGWKIEANAGAWGSRNPTILVLGVSKGPNQTKGILNMQHEDIPFKDERPYISKYLKLLGLLMAHEVIDSKISSEETLFAFGSIIRCGIGLWSEEKKEYVKVGNVVNSAATHHQAQEFVTNCTKKYLSNLPSNLRLVVLLSNDDDYMDSCFVALRKLHPDFRRHNQVSYGNSFVTFVHIVHASFTAGRHREDWLTDNSGKQARKREMALEGVKISGVSQA